MTTVPFFDLGSHIRDRGTEIHGAIEEVIAGGYFVGGPLVERFEAEFADYLGVDHCVGVGNGLDALRLAMEARNIGPGDEVIVPAFTFFATILSVIQIGATPVPVDVSLESANLDPSALEAAITERTRAIMPVHLYGRSAPMEAILEIAGRHRLDVFEDTAQAHGASSPAGMAGAVGTAGAFSFYPTKNLGALGDGGAVTTSDGELAARVRSRRSYGQGATKYDHVDSGWNSRLDAMQAAILSLQLRHLDEWNSRRRQIATTYFSGLGERASSVVGPRDVSDSVWHHFVLRSPDRAGLRAFLAENGVTTDVHYPYAAYRLEPVQRVLGAELRERRFAVADTLADQVTSLPMGPWMSDGQIDQVADALSRIPEELLA
ncbi:MAG TPA: DegT/DnrJ/EryC1/StrS family aminotransferase [Lacisediminihabitans sp.]|uniref:DegT/DnrJ/EryC1/StrS family aminotransferase n=1 Tax=Lacisediminihabitans sp. TaxID=2787631 RepID=UPI002ED9801E